MAVAQNTYRERMAAAVAGLVANENDFTTDTRICETVAGIGFGLAVGQGVADKGGVLGGALTGFVGVSVRDVTLVHDTPDKYARYDNMGVLFRGDIWVAPAVAVAANDPVHYVSATGVFTNTGDIGPIVGARWMTSAAEGELAVLRLSGHLP